MRYDEKLIGGKSITLVRREVRAPQHMLRRLQVAAGVPCVLERRDTWQSDGCVGRPWYALVFRSMPAAEAAYQLLCSWYPTAQSVRDYLAAASGGRTPK